MYKNSRRDFLVRMGLLSGAIVIGNKAFGNVSSRLGRFSLQPSLESVQMYCTGNLKNRSSLLNNLPDVVQFKNALCLDMGNFIDPLVGNNETVIQLNKHRFQVSAVGSNEWVLGEKELMKLASQCEFSLVKSHGRSTNKDWATWIKPYEIIYMGSRKIGVVALGPAQNLSKDTEAWLETHDWAKRLKKNHACDMVICLMPTGYEKTFVVDCIHASEALDMILCASLTEMKESNRVLKNVNNRDTLLVVGREDGSSIGKQVFNMQMDNRILPHLMTHKNLKNNRINSRTV